MQIDAKIYQVFYQTLLKKFIAEQIESDTEIISSSPMVWDNPGKGKGRKDPPIALELFDLGTNQYYFMRKYHEESFQKEMVPIRPNSLIDALHYLGVSLSKEEKGVNFHEKKIAEKLLQKFSALHLEEIIPIEKNDFANDDLEMARKTVVRFFDSLEKKLFFEAWQILHSSIQVYLPWNNFRNFKLRLEETGMRMRSVEIFAGTIKEDYFSFKMYFIQEVFAHTEEDYTELVMRLNETLEDWNKFPQKNKEKKLKTHRLYIVEGKKIDLTYVITNFYPLRQVNIRPDFFLDENMEDDHNYRYF